MGQTSYTPHAPDVLGVEWPALFTRGVPLSSSVELGTTFPSTVAEAVENLTACWVDPTPVGLYQFHLLGHVYIAGNELAVGPIERTLVPVNGGSLGGATLGGGAGNIASAVASPSDGLYVGLGPFTTPRFQFATAGMFANRRILRLVLHHVVSTISPPDVSVYGYNFPTLSTAIDRPGFTPVTVGHIRGDFPAASVRQTSLGEINPNPVIDHSTTSIRIPWTWVDVQAFDTVTLQVMLTGSSLGAEDLHYLALEVVHCTENRAAYGARRYQSAGGSDAAVATTAAVLSANVPLFDSGISVNWAKPSPAVISATFMLADGGGPWFDLPGSIVSEIQQYGSPPLLPTIDSFAVFENHKGKAIPRGPDNEPLENVDQSAAAAVSLTVAGVASIDGQPYSQRRSAPVHFGTDAYGEIMALSGGGSVDYPWLRFWARRFGDSDPLDFIVGASPAVITAADFDLLPEVRDGWRYVVLELTPPAVFDNSGFVWTYVFSSSSSVADRWEILVDRSDPSLLASDATFEGWAVKATYDAGSGVAVDVEADLAATFATAAPDLVEVVADDSEITLVGQGAGPCVPDGIGFIAISWESVLITGFGYYEVQRSDVFGQWDTIGQNVATPDAVFNDFEAKIGVLTSYRVRVVRADGTEGPWSATVTATIPNGPNTPSGLLVFTSNFAPGTGVAYAEVGTQAPEEEFGFPEAETVELHRFLGRDYQVGFRPLERGGTEFTRTLLVNGIVAPALTADKAFIALRDFVWDPALPYICVRDDLGNRWYATVIVPSGVIQRGTGGDCDLNMQLVQVRVVESTDIPCAAAQLPAPVVT